MPRPLRLEIAGGVYHVVARGNERKAIFLDDEDRQAYLARLAFCRRRFGFFLYAYCLMDNHVHLAIERGPISMGRIMLNQHAFYAQRFNGRHERVGHLFQGRYKSFLVQKERYLVTLLRYIHENPVKEGMVARPEDYVWSSGRFYRDATAPEWLDRDRVLSMSSDRSPAMEAATGPSYEETVSIGRVVKGSQEFAERVLFRSGEGRPLPSRKASGLTLERFAGLVARAEGLSIEALRRHGQTVAPSRARAMTAYLGRREAGISVACFARYFDRDGSTLARGVSRLEAQLAADHGLRQRVESMVAQLKVQECRA